MPIDGLVKLRSYMDKRSHVKDVDNAHKGIGLIIYLAQVISPAPELAVKVASVAQLTDDDFTLSVSGGDLVIPKHERLAIGDIVAICPLSGTHRWLVLCVTSDNNFIPPANDARIGFDGDKDGGSFSGIKVSIPDGDANNSGVVTVAGQTINITSFGGANVVIDGVNFKNHTHTYNPGPGSATNTGAPH
jgi:hypothetical protein